MGTCENCAYGATGFAFGRYLHKGGIVCVNKKAYNESFFVDPEHSCELWQRGCE